MHRGIKGVLLGTAIGLVGILVSFSTPGIEFERDVGLDWLFSTRGAISPPPEVAVIAIGGFTGDKLGFPELPREWPRTIHHRLIDTLMELGVSTIVFDIDFSKERPGDQDWLLAEAVAKSGRVVLLQRIDVKGQTIGAKKGNTSVDVWVEQLVSPVPVLTAAARGLGPFPLPKTEAAVHRFWIFKRITRDYPTLPAVGMQVHALQVYEQFARLLDESGVGASMDIPVRAENLATAADMENLMISLRNAINKQPQLADVLAAEMEEPWVGREDAATRTLLGALVSMYGGADQRLLNFYGPPGTITSIPYERIINDPSAVAAEFELDNRVVFVGFSDLHDPGQPDRFYTVFTNDRGIDLSGVEIGATAFGNLLHNHSLHYLSAGDTLFLLLALGLVVTLVVYIPPASLGIPAAAVLVAAYGYWAQLIFDKDYLWLPLAVPVLLQFPLAVVAGLTLHYLQQRHQVRHISEAIRYFVPDEVSEAMTGFDFKPENIDQVTFSTCLATDMQGFSTISEKMPPGDLADFLNDYFDTLAGPMREHDVSVTEFRADAIMCAWTADEPNQQVRRNPILASLQALDAIEDFKARHHVFDTSLRIGLEMGEVYVGHSGGGGQFGYSIVGDCANTASRIEGLNKQLGTQILASAPVIKGFDDLLCRPLGKFSVAGKVEPVAIVEVLCLATDASDYQRELCEQFAGALEHFKRLDWENAYAAFAAILKAYPHDGPTRFYLSECQSRKNLADRSEAGVIIRMALK